MKFFRKILLLLLVIIIIVGSACYLNGKKLYDKRLAEVSLDKKIEEIRTGDNFVSLAELPKYYKDAIVAVEDHRYYNHGAIDIIALGRAIVSNFKQKDFKEGGSTITQQVSKNLYFISEVDVVSRKVAEGILSFELERKYSKDEILEIYINTIYFGDGYYGIKEACLGYLKKEPKDMSIYEATMMAGIPNAPSVYAPTVNFNLTQSRQKKVVSSMLKYKYIDQKQADEIYNEIDTATYSK